MLERARRHLSRPCFVVVDGRFYEGDDPHKWGVTAESKFTKEYLEGERVLRLRRAADALEIDVRLHEAPATFRARLPKVGEIQGACTQLDVNVAGDALSLRLDCQAQPWFWANVVAIASAAR